MIRVTLLWAAASLACPGEPGLHLTETGEAEALKGYVVHAPGTLLAFDPEQRIYYAPSGAAKSDVLLPAVSRRITVADCPPDRTVDPAVDLPNTETPVAWTVGPISDIERALVVVSREGNWGPKPTLNRQLHPAHLRIYSGSQQLAHLELLPTAFVCDVIVDDLDDDQHNEIALVWASVANGYTIGVTVFAAH